MTDLNLLLTDTKTEVVVIAEPNNKYLQDVQCINVCRCKVAPSTTTGPTLRNSLSEYLRNENTLITLKNLLATYLFKSAYFH